MKLPRTLCSAAIFSIFCVAIPVKAVPITDSIDPADTAITSGSTLSPCPLGFTCSPGALSFVHDITADGFVVGVDTITAATLAIHLTDARGGGHENYEVDVGSGQTFASNVPSGPGGSVDTFALTSASIADLNDDGKMNVVVRSLSGSFSFADSLLTANDLPQRLSEPASLALLGIAFGGLGFGARRKRRQHLSQ